MIRNLKRTVAVGAMALLPLLAACGHDPRDPALINPASGEVRVELRNVQFQPQALTVKAGTLITFVNRDPMLHDVVQLSARQVGKKEPEFSSPALEQGQSWNVTLREPGTYPVLCLQAAHYTAGMVATITVVP